MFTGLFASDGLTITAAPGGEVFFAGRTAAYTTPTIAAGHTITYPVSITAHPGAHGVHYLAAATATLQTPDPNYKAFTDHRHQAPHFTTSSHRPIPPGSRGDRSNY